jgi:cytosine/uracil/thiamine/allantoin permease
VCFTAILNLVLLVACWAMGDLTIRTKVIFTLLFVASFGLLFTPFPLACIVAHCVLAAVIGFATFGPDWLSRRP